MSKLRNCAFVLGLVWAFAVICCEEKEPNGLEMIKKRGFLQVAVSSDDPPFGYVDDNGKNQGFEVAFAKELAYKLLGDTSKIEFIIVDPASRFDVLINGKADVVLSNFTHTPERAEILDFGLPYMKASISVVSPKTAPIRDLSELAGKKLIVSKGTTSEKYFLENHPEIEMVVLNRIDEVFTALKDGRGAALAQDNTVTFAWTRENSGFEVGINSLGSVEGIAPAVRKGNTSLLNFINKTIEELSEEQFFHQNFEKTLRTFMGPEANPDDFVVEGGKL
ncbi:MAG: transporter substrate-binding domain-containing protein [Fibromonadaceae bacterium]|jgi:polar amino acid transport system substrate-binding protein|nr:transporter substrate-binding domain-containing protein [Fibromonadaceae bacterium]